MIPCLITAPLALILYGIGIQHQLHWICPTIGLGLCKCVWFRLVTFADKIDSVSFAIAQGTNVCLVYVIDGYRPVAGEVTLAVMGFKCKCAPSARFGIEELTLLSSTLWLCPQFLHQPLDRPIWIPKRLRNYGGHLGNCYSDVGTAIHVGETASTCHMELVHCGSNPLE